MRRAAKIDDNQHEIVGTFRALGYSVKSLAQLGEGTPDLLLGKNTLNFLVEVKDGAKSPSQRKLTDDQIKFHGAWEGSIAIIESIDDVIAFDRKQFGDVREAANG